MTFKVNDVVQHTNGGAKYRIHAITDEGYKARRLDNGALTVLPFYSEQVYKITAPPSKEFAYYPGQVLLKKEGPPQIALILSVSPGVKPAFNCYEVAIYVPQGSNGSEKTSTFSYYEKEILEQYEIRNFKWVVLYGNPESMVRQSLQKEIARLKTRLAMTETILEGLVYFETELKNAKEVP
jgi:hypothetical protein